MTNLGALNKRLQSKMEQDRKELERQSQLELETLSKNLNALSQNALHTIEHDMQLKSQEISVKCGEILNEIEHKLLVLDKSLAKAWYRNFLIGIGIVAGLVLGTMGISLLLSNHLLNLQSELTALNEDKTRAEQSLVMLQRKTWGISFMENQQGKFLVLNTSKTLTPGWVVGNQQAWKVE